MDISFYPPHKISLGPSRSLGQTLRPLGGRTRVHSLHRRTTLVRNTRTMEPREGPVMFQEAHGPTGQDTDGWDETWGRGGTWWTRGTTRRGGAGAGVVLPHEQPACVALGEPIVLARPRRRGGAVVGARIIHWPGLTRTLVVRTHRRSGRLESFPGGPRVLTLYFQWSVRPGSGLGSSPHRGRR